MSKLVRDKIPEIIEKSGKKPIYHTAKKEEMLDLLLSKLKEEILELQNAETREEQLEELADVQEVEFAIYRFCFPNFLYDSSELNSIRMEKRKQRGEFEKRIVLDEVKE